MLYFVAELNRADFRPAANKWAFLRSASPKSAPVMLECAKSVFFKEVFDKLAPVRVRMRQAGACQILPTEVPPAKVICSPHKGPPKLDSP